MTDQSTNLTDVQRSGMRNAVISQCFGIFGYMALTNGTMLLFMKAMSIAPGRIAAYLSLPFLLGAFLRVPCAYIADRRGKKRIGVAGGLMMGIGFLVITVSGWFAPPLSELVVVLGVLLYGVGLASGGSSWFAILSPIVPVPLRGRFFSKLRFSWQLCSIVFSWGCAGYLSVCSSLPAYQLVMFLIAASFFIRLVFYQRIPELEDTNTGNASGMWSAIRRIIRIPGFMSFTAYIFLISTFTVGCPIVFGLVEKEIMGMSDNLVVILGSITMIGSLITFFFAGRIVDRFSTKPVFLLCHFGYGLLMVLFVLREFIPNVALGVVGAAHLLYGVLWAGVSVALSTELLGLVPVENKSLSTSLCLSVRQGGVALSGLLASLALDVGALKETWILGGVEMTRYDTILMVYGVMIVLLVVTLGLVPSVLRTGTAES